MAEASSAFPAGLPPQLRELLEHLESQLTAQNNKYLEMAHEKTKQPRAFLVLGGGVIFFLLLVWLTSLRFTSHLLSFQPVYRSYKALKTKSADDDAFWLTYWVINASFALLESFVEASLSWLPLFYVLKIIFTVWAHHPNTKGALVIYRSAVEPILNKLLAAENADNPPRSKRE